ncbi:hypothetical protein A464_4249 [Salmonella bongori N268-08]|uniref:Uncharacterized protein n=1 Tax=Salmonella bongori N268-08 TaxID=1197719 RepID=S5NME7_SALBN|nr:hypothetical protein A464_4249 [Salmonella bongori N268-08]
MQIIQEINATALGFLLPICFINFDFLSRLRKMEIMTPFLCVDDKVEYL